MSAPQSPPEDDHVLAGPGSETSFITPPSSWAARRWTLEWETAVEKTTFTSASHELEKIDSKNMTEVTVPELREKTVEETAIDSSHALSSQSTGQLHIGPMPHRFNDLSSQSMGSLLTKNNSVGRKDSQDPFAYRKKETRNSSGVSESPDPFQHRRKNDVYLKDKRKQSSPPIYPHAFVFDASLPDISLLESLVTRKTRPVQECTPKLNYSKELMEELSCERLNRQYRLIQLRTISLGQVALLDRKK